MDEPALGRGLVFAGGIVRDFCNDKGGAAAAEYAIIIAVIASLIVVGATLLGDAIGQAATIVGNRLL